MSAALIPRSSWPGTGFRALAVAVLAVSSLASAQPPRPLKCAITGNGALTAYMDEGGRLSALMWPSPSYGNHVGLTSQSPALGGMWGVRIGEDFQWLSHVESPDSRWEYEPDSPVIHFKGTLPGGGTALQTAFVYPKSDLLVWHIEIESATQPRLFWASALSPRTTVTPELPLWGEIAQAGAGFATFFDTESETIYFFRPRRPGSQEWRVARGVARGVNEPTRRNLATAWARFGEGVWLAADTFNPVVSFQCGIPGSSAVEQAENSMMGRNKAVVGGGGDAALELEPERVGNRYCATVLLSVGKDYTATLAGLAPAQRTYAALLEETVTWWRDWIATATFPGAANMQSDLRVRHGLVTIGLSMDRISGAIVSAPRTWPALKPASFPDHVPPLLNWPSECAWITGALDIAGYTALSERHLIFQAGAVRMPTAQDGPRGTLPSGLYADMTPGMPQTLLDTGASAWFLAACSRHCAALPQEARNKFLTRVWPAVEECANFLCSWKDGRTGEPLPGFDWEAGRDTSGTRQLLVTYMGIDAARLLSASFGRREPPEWTARKRELDALVRFRCVDGLGQWRDAEILPFWTAEFRRNELPPWTARLEALMTRGKEDATLKTPAYMSDLAEGLNQNSEAMARLCAWREEVARVASPLNSDEAAPGYPNALNAARLIMTAARCYSSGN